MFIAKSAITRRFTSFKSMLKASANYPKGYPVPLCGMVMIVLLVLDDLVTLPGLPPLENTRRRKCNVREVKPRVLTGDFGFSTNVKTIRDFPQVSGRNALLIFLSKIERMERIVPHFAWHSDTNYQIIINPDNCNRQETRSSYDYRHSNRNARYNFAGI